MAKEEAEQPNRRNLCRNCCRFWPAYLNMVNSCNFSLIAFSYSALACPSITWQDGS